MSLTEELRGLLDEAKQPPALAMGGEEPANAFKVSSKALSLFKSNIGDDWKPEHALFQKQLDQINALSPDELSDLFGADSMDKAQDVIASNPRAAFNKWLSRLTRISPKLGKVVRSQPSNAALIFYKTVEKVSGRDIADTILKRYFETESDHPGAVKAKLKIEALEEALATALLSEEAPDTFDRMIVKLKLMKESAENGSSVEDLAPEIRQLYRALGVILARVGGER
jgi:hypothetical protein